MAAPTGDSRIIQIHPLRHCNLKCRHCYSGSAPREKDILPIDVIQRALPQARNAGYSVVGVSGGEPLLYPDLPELLSSCADAGLLATVTTNGMLLDARRVNWLKNHTHLVAVSIDGNPESHNSMRGSARAFEEMAKRVPLLHEAGIPFGFIFTLTQFNLDELEWVAEFALKQGAALLQIHPLEAIGRAVTDAADAIPDALELSAAYLESLRIQAFAGDNMVVHFDALDRDFLAENPESFFSSPSNPPEATPFAEILSPLIVEADGTVSPLDHGFSRSFSLGNLHTSDLQSLMETWRATRLEDFRHLCRSAWEELTQPTEWPFVNWYAELNRKARETALEPEEADQSISNFLRQS